MLIPQSVSYATSLAGMSPLAGLFSASVPGLAYAMLGTSRQLNVAPEAALSLIVGQAVRDMQHDYDPEMKHSTAIGLAVSTVITFQVRVMHARRLCYLLLTGANRSGSSRSFWASSGWDSLTSC